LPTGCQPVTLWGDEDGAEYLIDGQSQAEICDALGREVTTTVFSGTEEEAIPGWNRGPGGPVGQTG